MAPRGGGPWLLWAMPRPLALPTLDDIPPALSAPAGLSTPKAPMPATLIQAPDSGALPDLPVVTRPRQAADRSPRRRSNPYAAPHKALRHALMGQLQWLGALDAHDDAQVAAVLRELRNLLDRLATHQRLETEFLHPALDARQPGLIGGATQDHLDDLAHAAALHALADQAAAEHDLTARAALLGRLYREFAPYTARQLRHMAHEEDMLAPMFMALFDDTQLQALQQRALATLPRWERLAMLLMMADALNPDELAAVLLDLRDRHTAEAWMGLVMAAQGRTGAARWPAVQQRLQAAGAL